MTDFEAKVLNDLSVLKTQMEQLMGIGQPGRLHHMEERVSRNEQGVQRMKGMMAAFGTGLTMVHLAISYFGGKHN
jgi:hypothetical protein